MHERITDAAGIGADCRLRDRTPAPSLEKPANVVEDDNSGSEESTIIVGPQEGGGDQLLGGDPGPGGSIGDCGSKNQEKKICSISNSESESGSVPVIGKR